jgi:DNA-binding transcriptional ArsR family regulator
VQPERLHVVHEPRPAREPVGPRQLVLGAAERDPLAAPQRLGLLAQVFQRGVGRLATVLQALSDPVRLRLVAALLGGESRSCAPEFWDVEVHKSTLSHHYKVLREAGLTLTHVHGRSRSVELRHAELDERFPGLLTFLSAAVEREFPAAPSPCESAGSG